jgi:hypothetical protein
VTELCPAPTLAQKLAEQPLPVRDAVTMMGTVASAVEALAAHGLAPRELSPESIHLHRTRGAILDDPGVPTALGPRAKVVSPSARGYLSPEELSGGAPVPGSLVYTLGAILRDSVSADTPRPLQRVIEQATAEDPDERYEHPGAFAFAAAAAIPGVQALGPRRRRPQSRAAPPRPEPAPMPEPAVGAKKQAGRPAPHGHLREAMANAAGLVARVKLPGLKAPHLSAPRVTVPRVNLPKLNVPKLKVPRLKVPRLKVPRLTVPRLNVPRLNVPRLNVPRLNVPRLNVPRLNVPRLQERHLAAAGMAAVAAVGAIAIVTMLGGGGGTAGDARVASAALKLDLPSGWEPSRVTEAGGIALTAPVAASSSETRARLVAGLARDSAQVRRLVGAAAAEGAIPRNVQLGDLEAQRWTNARVSRDIPSTLFLGYTSSGPLVAICHQQAGGTNAHGAPCSAVLETLRLTGPRPVSLGSVQQIRRELRSALSVLGEDRIKGRQALATAPLADEQANAAESLALHFSVASQTIAAIPTPRGTTDLSAVVGALDATAGAYDGLADAILGGDPVDFDIAREQILDEEAGLQRKIAAAAIR